jgi:hypothetical protein
MAENLAEIAAIADNPAPATFENTLVALERSGQLLWRVKAIFDNLTGTITNPRLQEIEQIIAPRLAAHARRDPAAIPPSSPAFRTLLRRPHDPWPRRRIRCASSNAITSTTPAPGARSPEPPNKKS